MLEQSKCFRFIFGDGSGWESKKKRERDARRNNTFKIASRLTNHKSCKQTKKINNNNAEIFKCWMEEFISPVERGVYECMQEQKRK